MRGGQLNKARRGELEMGPPVGFVYQTDGSIGLDPDVQVQSALRMIFETSKRTGGAVQTVRFFREQGLQFPRRLWTGANKATSCGPYASCRCCTIRSTPVPLSRAARAHATGPRGASAPSRTPGRTGRS